MAEISTHAPLKVTPLHAVHLAAGARMVGGGFGGAVVALLRPGVAVALK